MTGRTRKARVRFGERVKRTCRITNETPRELIARASELVPDWRPLKARVMLSSKGIVYLELDFGVIDGQGRTLVEIECEKADLGPLVAYLLVHAEIKGFICCFSLPVDDEDDDGGESLNLPSASECALAEMPASVGIH